MKKSKNVKNKIDEIKSSTANNSTKKSVKNQLLKKQAWKNVLTRKLGKEEKNINELNEKTMESTTEKTVIEKLKEISRIEKARMMFLVKRETKKQREREQNK